MGANSQFARQLAISEDFNSLNFSIRQSRIPQGALIHTGTFLKLIQGIDIYRLVTSSVPSIVETSLGDSPDKRHLPAFEADPDRAAGASGLTLAAASAGFAVAAGFALAKALAAMPGARTRFNIV